MRGQASIDSPDPAAYIAQVKPGELQRRLSRQVEQAATARARLGALGREVDAVRAVIDEIAQTLRGAEPARESPDDHGKTPPYAG
jgi:hypothetical protein